MPGSVNIQVMDFVSASAFSCRDDIGDTSFVSIDDRGWPPTPLDLRNPRVTGVLKLWFDDVSFLPDGSFSENGMSAGQAGMVAGFVRRRVSAGDRNIVFHCAGGISRSAGVAAAVGRWLFADDGFLMDDFRRCANAQCYIRMLDALGVPYERGREMERLDEQHRLHDAFFRWAYPGAQNDVDGYDEDVDAAGFDSMPLPATDRVVRVALPAAEMPEPGPYGTDTNMTGAEVEQADGSWEDIAGRVWQRAGCGRPITSWDEGGNDGAIGPTRGDLSSMDRDGLVAFIREHARDAAGDDGGLDGMA